MTRLPVVVIDYGAGNVRSVAKALEAVGAAPRITGDPGEVARAEALVLPGQGACDAAMRSLEARGLTQTVRDAIAGGRPFFGVCLGLQLLFESTEEGDAECLGVVMGKVQRLPVGLKVPHMGWNTVEFKAEHPVFDGVPSGSYFYFVHSYYPNPSLQGDVAATTSYGIDFCCAVARGNMVATQFHPEKSGALGLKLYSNFVALARQAAA